MERQVTIEEMRAFLAKELAVAQGQVRDDADIENDLGCTGDDFSELMEAYAKRFNVDMVDYLWYFHHAGEGHNIGGWFFPSPDQRVDRIPVTPALLTTFAERGRWAIDYPPPALAGKRWDLLFNRGVVAVVLLWAMVSLLGKC